MNELSENMTASSATPAATITPNARDFYQGDVAAQVEQVEQRLKELMEHRTKTQAHIKEQQGELEKLLKKVPSRSRETIAELDSAIKKLEYQRTTTSIELKEERDILRQISRLEKKKRDVEEYEKYDRQIKDKKSLVAGLREVLKTLSSNISELRVEATTLKTARDLGCSVEDLLGMKVDVPQEKLGMIIGKKGSNVKQLMEKSNVTLDVVKNDDPASTSPANIRIVGALHSLEAVSSDLEKVLAMKEETLKVKPELITYLTAKNITELQELRERHPDVYIDVQRKNKDTIRLRGVPDDIESMREDLLSSCNVVTREIQLTDRETSLIVGRQGGNVERLVQTYQASVLVERKKSDADDKSAVALVVGPLVNVTAAVDDIEEMIANHKDESRTLAVGKVVKQVLLLNGGAGIQQMQKLVNESVAASPVVRAAAANSPNAADLEPVPAAAAIGFTVSMNFGNKEDSLIIRAKAIILSTAMEIVEHEISRLESSKVVIKVDPFVIPTLIGKGGEVIKQMKEGTKSVVIEIDRNASEVHVCGLERNEIDKVKQAVELTITGNKVRRIGLDPTIFVIQHRELVRSPMFKQLNELVFSVADDDKAQLVLRGSDENLDKAEAMVRTFLDENYMEEFNVTSEDLNVLLLGGKESKIVEFAKQLEVALISDRDRLTVVIGGKKEKVEAAKTFLNNFLHGGDGIAVSKIHIDEQLHGIVIGKGGKKKAELEKKHGNVTITLQRKGDLITVRGNEKEVEACRIEIIKLVATARVTENVTITEKQYKLLSTSNFTRRIYSLVPVQITMTESTVTVKGFKTDVRDAVSLLKQEINGIYESSLYFSSAEFNRLKDACRDPAYFERIEKMSNARVAIDAETESIIFRGSQKAVKAAKEQLLKFVEFLFPSGFVQFLIPGTLLASMGRAEFIAEVSATTGADIRLDRNLESILVFSPDPDKIEKASELIKTKIKDFEKRVFTIQLAPDEDWLVSAIIGRGGKRIKALRKEINCNIDVNSKENRVMITSDDEESLAKARDNLLSIIEKERRECAFVEIPEELMSAFIGRSGAHITQFSDKHGVEVQIMKSMNSTVRITGEETKVNEAKAALEEWLTGKEQVQAEMESSETLKLRKEQVPAVIGTKGATIRAIEKEFGCRVDVDRNEPSVSVRGSSPAKRLAAIEKIKEIIAIGSGKDVIALESSEDLVTGVPAAEPKTAQVTPARPKNNNTTSRVPQPYEFPALVTRRSDETSNDSERSDREQDCTTDTNEISNLNTQSWASMVSVPSQSTSQMQDDSLDEKYVTMEFDLQAGNP